MSLYHAIKIGTLEVTGNLFLAPVAGYSDRAFRYICKENGADMGYTEMVSSEAIYRGSDKSEKLLLKASNDPLFAVQIFGGNETAIFEGASFIIKKYKPSLLDINAGCPVPKIIKSGAGSALTREPEKLYKIVKAAILATKETGNQNLPITVKIRSGWDSSHLSWKEAALAAYEAGVAAITIHPRTKVQGYEGKSDWTLLAELSKLFKDKFHSSGSKIQIFGSGDVFSPEDAKNMLEQTKCDGVMFARGAMGNPFIFNQTKDLLTKGSYQEVSIQHRINTGLKELAILIEDTNEQIACKEMRKRFCCYTKGFPGSSQIRMKIVQAESFEDYKKIFSSLL